MSEDEPTAIRRKARLRDADGGADPCVVVLTGRKVGRVLRVAPTGSVVGRGADNDIVLEDDGISRRHCLIFAMGPRWRIRDLGSTNGTFLGELTVGEDPVDLPDGARIRLGPDVILRFGTQDAIERQFLDHLYRSATRDALTGLANRRLFQDQLETEVAWHRRHERPLSLLYLDLDRFKDVNDRHGHGAGDAVLRGLAETLTREVRTEDLVCRHGGEEFVVLLRETPPDVAAAIAERLRAAVEKLALPPGPVTVSIGVAGGAGNALSTADDLLRDADARMYAAKQAGRNRVSS